MSGWERLQKPITAVQTPRQPPGRASAAQRPLSCPPPMPCDVVAPATPPPPPVPTTPVVPPRVSTLALRAECSAGRACSDEGSVGTSGGTAAAERIVDDDEAEAFP